jgi:hypothetical protein
VMPDGHLSRYRGLSRTQTTRTKAPRHRPPVSPAPPVPPRISLRRCRGHGGAARRPFRPPGRPGPAEKPVSSARRAYALGLSGRAAVSDAAVGRCSIAPSAVLYHATAAAASGTMSITEITGGEADIPLPGRSGRSFDSAVMPTACRTSPTSSLRARIGLESSSGHADDGTNADPSARCQFVDRCLRTAASLVADCACRGRTGR